MCLRGYCWLGSVYKEKALGDVDIDPVYLNGWVAVYQFLFSIPLLIPSAIASNVRCPHTAEPRASPVHALPTFRDSRRLCTFSGGTLCIPHAATHIRSTSPYAYASPVMYLPTQASIVWVLPPSLLLILLAHVSTSLPPAPVAMWLATLRCPSPTCPPTCGTVCAAWPRPTLCSPHRAPTACR